MSAVQATHWALASYSKLPNFRDRITESQNGQGWKGPLWVT